MSTRTPEELLAEIQQKLATLQNDPHVVLLQTRDHLGHLCHTVGIMLRSLPPRNPTEWRQEADVLANLRDMALKYISNYALASSGGALP